MLPSQLPARNSSGFYYLPIHNFWLHLRASLSVDGRPLWPRALALYARMHGRASAISARRASVLPFLKDRLYIDFADESKRSEGVAKLAAALSEVRRGTGSAGAP